ncbi:MAG: hypothetical protein V4677_02300 [Bacteroidota bacterium]
MKAIFITTLILFLQLQLNAQESAQNFEGLKQSISKISPEIDLTNKLIFISTWKSTDFESREMNKEAYRVYKIYENARLKNGEKGTVFISLNLDTDDQNRSLAIGKDGIEQSVVYSDTQLITMIQSQFNLSGTQNIIVMDKTGAIQYTNLSKDQIFPSLRNLITR